jgi:hypothetical protein
LALLVILEHLLLPLVRRDLWLESFMLVLLEFLESLPRILHTIEHSIHSGGDVDAVDGLLDLGNLLARARAHRRPRKQEKDSVREGARGLWVRRRERRERRELALHDLA